MKGIYLITNKVNNKKYVGLSNDINRRFSEHKTPKNITNKTTVLAKAFRKYNIDNFEFEILEIVDDVELLAEREIFWIEKLSPEYNMNKGGQGNLGFEISEEIKQILRKAGKSQWASKSDTEKQFFVKNNLKGPKKGHIVTTETRRKLKIANLGKSHSDLTKSKIGIANKVSMIGNKSGNKKISAIKDGVVIKTFESTVIASKELNISKSCIWSALNGKQKTAAGYSWKYGV